LSGEFGIGELLHLWLKRVDRRDFRPIALETAIVRGAENLFRKGAQHYKTTFLDTDRSTLFNGHERLKHDPITSHWITV